MTHTAKHQHRIGHACGDARRRTKDAAANRDADDDTDGAPEPEPTDEGGPWPGSLSSIAVRWDELARAISAVRPMPSQAGKYNVVCSLAAR